MLMTKTLSHCEKLFGKLSENSRTRGYELNTVFKQVSFKDQSSYFAFILINFHVIFVYSVKYVLVAALGIKRFSSLRVDFIIQIIFKTRPGPLNNIPVGSFRNKYTILAITTALID